LIRIGIIGGAGYTGGELLRILLRHPQSHISFVHSSSHAGRPLSDAHADLLGETDLKFTDQLTEDIEVLILCVGHGEAAKFLANNTIAPHIKIIDLSQDHRLGRKDWIYGLPELNREKIRKAQFLANPGCFATCIQLAILPLAANQLLHNDIHISATTGSTGAGQKPDTTTHFSWRNNNLSVYKAFEHQHLGEIGQSLRQLQADFEYEVNFIPYRGNFTRGILASVYTSCSLSETEAIELYQSYYRDHPFVFLSASNPDLKQVVNTNKGVLYLKKHNNKLLIISIIDNLIKGASGQAVQNMNLMFDRPENEGLQLKATLF
jgi:N-acetyl-gamma-glutamyl-phosphate reductase